MKNKSRMDSLRSGADLYVADSNEATEFKIVRSIKDIEDDKCAFKPEMSHQIFGDSENIFGYKDLKIRIYTSAARLSTYIGVDYSEKIDADDFDGVEPDNILKNLSKWYQPGFFTNVDSFVERLNKEAEFTPFGELKRAFTLKTENNEESNYEIYHCETQTKGFLDYHERLQPFLIWYIDGASYIDIDDDKWKFFILYEKYSSGSQKMYSIAGYITVYEYYAYPMHLRPRISQVLVLPPYQRRGLCTHLLKAVYNHYSGKSNILDITVEDPTEEFQLVRDFVDACRCEKLDSYSHHNLKNGFTEKMIAQAKESFKINKKQARRIYEILRLKATNMNDENDYRDYRICVKRRLNIPYQKEQGYMSKLKPLLNEQEYATTLNLNGFNQRVEQLDKQYKQLEEQYLHVVRRCERESGGFKDHHHS